MTKYKVGDRVKVVAVVDLHDEGNSNPYPQYKKYIDNVYTIIRVDASRSYPYSINNEEEGLWCDEELILTNTNTNIIVRGEL